MIRYVNKKRHARFIAICLGLGLWCASSSFALANVAESHGESATLTVVSVEVQGNKEMRKDQIRRLLPALQAGEVNIQKLSSEVQLVNDANAIHLNVDLQANPNGGFAAIIKVDELANVHDTLSVSNTGNAYTGDYRLTNTFVNTNFTNRADAFGISFVTSPGHWDEVMQAGLFYRQILPSAGDSIYFTYTYSDVQMGRIASFGDFAMDASGKGQSYGVHYQKNLTYEPNKKEYLDFGLDHKKYDNSNILNIFNPSQPDYQTELGTDINVTTLGLMYVRSSRSSRQATAYNIGYITNINGDKNAYDLYRSGSDKQFGIFKAGYTYQQKLSGDWLANIRLNGQYTKSDLITTEQLGVGGMYSVRGFDESTIGADNGYIANIELYSPEIATGQRIVLFTDIGHLYNNHANAGELTSDTIASVGIGYRYNDKHGWNASLDYGYITNNIDGKTDQDHGKLHLSISKKL